MGTPSACWRRGCDFVGLQETKAGKKQSFLQQDTELSALAKKEQKAGKDCMELVRLLEKRFDVRPCITTS